MTQRYLPRGYYCVIPYGRDETEKQTITVGPHTYTLRPDVDAFADIGLAQEAALDTPDMVLPGLNYDRFDAPVLLFLPGRHKIDKHIFKRSQVLLGAAAGISPDIYTAQVNIAPAQNPERGAQVNIAPAQNPERGAAESVLVGSFWYGNMFCNDSAEEADEGREISTIAFDGFTFEAARIIVNVKKSKRFDLILKNLVYTGPCGKTLISMSGLGESDPCRRTIRLEGIRLNNYDGYDYGGSFIRPCAADVKIRHLYYANTDKPFGFTDFSYRTDNAPKNMSGEVANIKVSDSYFENIGGTGGVSMTSCKPLSISFENCGFYNASPIGEAVFQPRLQKGSMLGVRGCHISDTRGAAAAVSCREGGKVVLDENTITGYDTDIQYLPEPPRFIVERETPTGDYTTEEEDGHVVLADGNYHELEGLYSGRAPRYGDLHIHSDSGGTSDGRVPLGEYTRRMDELGMDFATIVDHKQMRHMYLPEFDQERMIFGSEPGTGIISGLSNKVRKLELHYNMIFPQRDGLSRVMAAFPEFEWSGGELDGSYKYPRFARERFFELAEFIRSLGGCFVHAHPKQIMASDEPLDFYLGEHTYIELIHGDAYNYESYANYGLWCELIARGKHIYASGGSDAHGALTNSGVSVFYSPVASGEEYVKLMHDGNFTVGYAGIKMCYDRYPMGAEAVYSEGAVLSVCTGDFFAPQHRDNTVYELRIISDRGIVYRCQWSGTGECCARIKAQKRNFYRAEVYDLTRNCPVAMGNPIFIN